jgi:hypothetical protein
VIWDHPRANRQVLGVQYAWHYKFNDITTEVSASCVMISRTGGTHAHDL